MNMTQQNNTAAGDKLAFAKMRKTLLNLLVETAVRGQRTTTIKLSEAFSELEERRGEYYSDASKDLSFRGRGNAASRRLGYVYREFRCSCESSPCQHEPYYEAGVGKYEIPFYETGFELEWYHRVK